MSRSRIPVPSGNGFGWPYPDQRVQLSLEKSKGGDVLILDFTLEGFSLDLLPLIRNPALQVPVIALRGLILEMSGGSSPGDLFF
jgi:hypothetical protein